MLRAKNREALGLSYFKILSKKQFLYFFYSKRAFHQESKRLVECARRVEQRGINILVCRPTLDITFCAGCCLAFNIIFCNLKVIMGCSNFDGSFQHEELVNLDRHALKIYFFLLVENVLK